MTIHEQDAPIPHARTRAPPAIPRDERWAAFARALPHILTRPARETVLLMFLDAPNGGRISMTITEMMEHTALSRSAQYRALALLIRGEIVLLDGWSKTGRGRKIRRLSLDVGSVMHPMKGTDQ